MKVCEKCGAQLEDNAQFCVGCGSKVGGAQETVSSEKPKKVSPFAANVAKNGGNKVALIGIIAAGVVVLFLIIAFFVNLFGGYKKPIKAQIKAANKSLKYQGVGYLPAEANQYKCKITYSIEDSDKISDGKLKDLAEIFEDKYDEEYKFGAGKVVEVEVKYEYGKDSKLKDTKSTEYFIVVRKGLKWYVYDTVSESSTYKDIDEVVKTYISRNKED